MRTVVAMSMLLLMLSTAAVSQVGSHLKEEFQDPEKHGIRIVDRVSELRGAMHDDKVRIICLQALGEALSPETQGELLEWVRAGRTVWFYDARLAPSLGMKPYLLSEEQFRHKPEKGVLGGSKRAGLATVGLSHGNHAVQTGVGQVTVFLPEIDNGPKQPKSYGAVEAAGDTVPLLQFALDSPALMALRREGRGLIVFKALLWNEPLSGDRFQLNLLDFSAGFQVPGPAGQGKVGYPPGPEAHYVIGEPALPLEAGSAETSVAAATTLTPARAVERSPGKGGWTLELKDGTTLSGSLETETLEFETGTQSLKLKLHEVEGLEFGSSIKLDTVVTTKGKKQMGLLLSTPLKFRTERGVEQFDKEDLQRLFRDTEDLDKETSP